MVKPVPLDLDLLQVPGGTTAGKSTEDNPQGAEPKQ
jgi:hypothetical protein